MAKGLDERVLALPAELYNKVYFYVFTAGGTNKAFNYQALDKTYKPPTRLQVNSASRAHCAPLYYSTTIFTVQHLEDFMRWFENLDKRYIPLLRGFRLILRNILVNRDQSTWQIDTEDLEDTIVDRLQAAKITAGWDIINVKVLEDFWAIDIRMVRW